MHPYDCFVFLSDYPSIHLSMPLSVSLSIALSVHPSMRLYVPSMKRFHLISKNPMQECVQHKTEDIPAVHEINKNHIIILINIKLVQACPLKVDIRS